MSRKKLVIVIIAVIMMACNHVLHAANVELTHAESIEDCIMFIEDGTSWEVEVKSNKDLSLKPFIVTQSLDGTEEINGKKYIKLWSSREGEDKELISYIRIDRAYNGIFALPADDIDSIEKPIYCFGNRNDSYALLNLDGTLSEDEYNIVYEATTDFTYNNHSYPNFHYKVYSASDVEHTDCLGTVQWIYGMGSIAGFANQLYCVNKEWTTKLRRIVTSCSGIVYEDLSASLDSFVSDLENSGIKYRPDGTIFREGDTGIYIMDGKKYYQGR